MTATERLQLTIGRLVIENATLAAKVDELEEKLREKAEGKNDA